MLHAATMIQAKVMALAASRWIMPRSRLPSAALAAIPAEQSFKIQDKFIHDLLNSVDPATCEFVVRKGAAVMSVCDG
jgi:hypothetical protein